MLACYFVQGTSLSILRRELTFAVIWHFEANGTETTGLTDSLLTSKMLIETSAAHWTVIRIHFDSCVSSSREYR